jgi:hypothetical protein
MNLSYRHPEPRIATWLGDGPDAATAESRRAIATAVRQIPQRRVAGPFEIARQSRLLAAAALLVALAAFGVAAAGLRPVVPMPAPSPAPAPRITGTLDHADRPMSFTYVLPDGSDVALRDTPVGSGLAVFSTHPLTDTDVEPGSHGVTVADVTSASEHGSTRVYPRFGATATEFLAGLDASAYFVVQQQAPTNLAGRPGWSARVSTEGEGWKHIDFVRPSGGKGTAISFANPSVIFVTDVGDAVLLVQVWADTAENLEPWLRRAMPFVDSIEFQYEPRW